MSASQHWFRIVDQESSADLPNERCFTIVRNESQATTTGKPQNEIFPRYCFCGRSPKLSSVYSPYEKLLTRFADVVPMQRKYLPRDLSVFDGEHELLTARVDAIHTIEASDPAFLPDAVAIRTKLGKSNEDYPQMINISAGVAASRLVKKVEPIYPAEARKERVQGSVMLAGTLGTDGKLHYLHVISTPAASLGNSAFRAVSQWEYKPYELNGEKIPADTVINVPFALDQ